MRAAFLGQLCADFFGRAPREINAPGLSHLRKSTTADGFVYVGLVEGPFGLRRASYSFSDEKGPGAFIL